MDNFISEIKMDKSISNGMDNGIAWIDQYVRKIFHNKMVYCWVEKKLIC